LSHSPAKGILSCKKISPESIIWSTSMKSWNLTVKFANSFSAEAPSRKAVRHTLMSLLFHLCHPLNHL
jgi:hypothetical protein